MAVVRDSESARELVRARWDSPYWVEVRSLARSRKIAEMLARSPITPAEAATIRALLPPVREDGAGE
jgi:hypothetical protein